MMTDLLQLHWRWLNCCHSYSWLPCWLWRPHNLICIHDAQAISGGSYYWTG